MTPFDLILMSALLSVIWMMLVHQLYRGWTKGEMSYGLRGGGSRTCRRTEEPIGFWGLFALYVLAVILIPAMAVYAWIRHGAT